MFALNLTFHFVSLYSQFIVIDCKYRTICLNMKHKPDIGLIFYSVQF